MTRHAAWDPKTGQWISVRDMDHAQALARRGCVVIGYLVQPVGHLEAT